MATCSLLATARGRGCRGGGPGDMHERLSLLVPPRIRAPSILAVPAHTLCSQKHTQVVVCQVSVGGRTRSMVRAVRRNDNPPPPGVVATATTAAAARPAQKLDVNVLRYLSKEDFRVLTAVEMGQKNVRWSLHASLACREHLSDSCLTQTTTMAPPPPRSTRLCLPL